MRDRTDRLLEHRALGRDRSVDSAADHLSRQPEMVSLGIEPEQRDPKAVLAACGPVAASGVAPGPHEHRHDVEPETERRLDRRLRDLDRYGGRLAAEATDSVVGAVGRRIENGPVAPHELRVGQG